MFRKLGQEVVLVVGKKYFDGSGQATHVGVFRGKVCFFRCLSEDYFGKDCKGLKWRFYALAGFVVSFPDYELKAGAGHRYGNPIFLGETPKEAGEEYSVSVPF